MQVHTCPVQGRGARPVASALAGMLILEARSSERLPHVGVCF